MSSNHTTIDKLLDRYRAKRLRFFVNGDKFFTGLNYALNTEKIRSFDYLLNDLTKTLSSHHLKICKGVRFIFSIDGRLINSLQDFEDGNPYVCSSLDIFTPTEYQIPTGILNWLVRNSACISSSKNIKIRRANHFSPSINNNHNNSKLLLTPTTKPTSQNGNNNQAYRSNRSTPASSPKVVTRHTPKKTIPNQDDCGRNSTTTKPVQIPSSIVNKVNEDQTVPFHSDVLEKFDVGRPIGDGHFSIVYCCMNKTSQQFCALKLIDKLKCRGRDDMIYNEVKILKQLSHPNIVKLMEEFDHKDRLYLILELVQDGDLFDAISTVTKFDENHVSTMIHNLSSALAYLHAQGIVHRDIKPENLLISIQEDGSQSLKLADFGLAVEVGDTPLYNVCGTAFYVSPEMLNESGYDYKVDVWSTGVICFILLCGYPPFTSENESNQDELFDAILAGDFQFALPDWSKISQHAKSLIRCMLTVDPEQRYTAEQVFHNPWTMGTSNNFEGVDPMNISRKIALQSQ